MFGMVGMSAFPSLFLYYSNMILYPGNQYPLERITTCLFKGTNPVPRGEHITRVLYTLGLSLMCDGALQNLMSNDRNNVFIVGVGYRR